jgi:hypothetical protein
MLALFVLPLFSYGVTFKMDIFPYKKYIFRMMKVPYAEWNNVKVIQEGVRELKFSYGGKDYDCLSMKCGEIYVSCSDNTKTILYIPIHLFKYKTITIAVPNEHKW